MYDLLNHGLRELLAIQRGGGRPSKRYKLSRRFRQRIFWRDNGKCVYCDRSVRFADATMDHFIPLVRKGAARSKENIVTSCKSCNAKKGPLQQEVVDHDLTPEALAYKFYEVTENTKKRQGHFKDWIADLDKA